MKISLRETRPPIPLATRRAKASAAAPPTPVQTSARATIARPRVNPAADVKPATTARVFKIERVPDLSA